MKSSKGFSLMETIIVIAVIGILSAIAVPSLIGQRSNTNLRDAVSMIRGNFEMARSRAIRENAFVPIIINPAGDGYSIFVDNGLNLPSGGGGGVPGDWLRNGDERLLYDSKLPAGVQIDLNLSKTTFTNLRTRFNGRGYITNNGILTLLSAGKTATVDMSNRFGRIKTKICDLNTGICNEG